MALISQPTRPGRPQPRNEEPQSAAGAGVVAAQAALLAEEIAAAATTEDAWALLPSAAVDAGAVTRLEDAARAVEAELVEPTAAAVKGAKLIAGMLALEHAVPESWTARLAEVVDGLRVLHGRWLDALWALDDARAGGDGDVDHAIARRVNRATWVYVRLSPPGPRYTPEQEAIFARGVRAADLAALEPIAGSDWMGPHRRAIDAAVRDSALYAVEDALRTWIRAAVGKTYDGGNAL